MALGRSLSVAAAFAGLAFVAARTFAEPSAPLAPVAEPPPAAELPAPTDDAAPAALADLAEPPRFLTLRSLRTLRAGVFQVPIVSPRDFAVGPLAVIPASFGDTDVARPRNESIFEAPIDGAAVRPALKAAIQSWPAANRAAKGDLDFGQSSSGFDPASAEGQFEASVVPPFEREPAPVSPADGATPAAAAPVYAALKATTTRGAGETPVEVLAVPALPPPVPAAGTALSLRADPILTDLPRRTGLDDGIARPLDLPPVAWTKAQLCLAKAIYHEARGESTEGQIAVAQVVLNRVRSIYYPADVCGVVYQNSWRRNACQFSFACDGIPEREDEPGPWRKALTLAQKVLDAEVWIDDVGNATHYHATYVSPRWIRDMVRKDRIGRHVFYRVRWWS